MGEVCGISENFDDSSYYAGSVAGHSALMLAATALSGLSGFVYVVLMSRMLSLEEFSVFYTLLNFFTIFSVPAMTFEMAVSRLTSRLRAAGGCGAVFHLIKHSVKKVTAGALAAAVFLVPLSIQASRLLSLPGPAPVIITCLAVMFFMPLNIGYGAVQGLQKFKCWGAILIAVSFARLGAGTAFVSSGFGVNGAIGASVFSIGLGVVLLAFPLRPCHRAKNENAHTVFKISGLREIFIALLLMTYLGFGDMLLVRFFFSSEASAVYGAASILGRAVFYTALPVSMALFPKICFARARGIEPGRILFKSILIFLALSGFLSSVFFFADGLAVRILFPQDYSAGSGLVKYFGFVFMPAGLCLLLVQYNLALGRRKFIFCLLAAAAAHFVLIVFLRAELSGVLAAVAASGSLGLGMLIRCSRGRR